jgi:hypothetical protein
VLSARQARRHRTRDLLDEPARHLADRVVPAGASACRLAADWGPMPAGQGAGCSSPVRVCRRGTPSAPSVPLSPKTTVRVRARRRGDEQRRGGECEARALGAIGPSVRCSTMELRRVRFLTFFVRLM